MNGRCYLCLDITKYRDAVLCTNCFCRLQDYQWLSCGRCGNLSCSGCNELIDFNRVTSLFIYKDILAEILLLAKEVSNLNAQKVFHQLFFIPVKNALLKIISQENYNFIMVAPLRKDRIFNGSWHPNIFYDEVLHYIHINETIENKPQILYPSYSVTKKKQSFLPSNERKQAKAQNLELIFSGFKQETNMEIGKIILLDDVLTSGETSLLSKRLSEEKFSNYTWDLFTILRAPQSQER